VTSHSTTNLQINISQTWNLLQAATNVGESDDVKDLYYLIEFLVFLVENEYPAIPCKAGCSQCCIDSGLPRVTALEWRHIHGYMAKTMPEGLRAQVISQNEALHRPQLELFLQEQARIAAPKTDLPLPPFGCSQCPFLIEGMCTIYPVRPAICRAYGYFTWRRGPDQGSQVFACQMAAETLLDSLRSQGTETLAMPVWNRFQEKLYALNGEGAMIATLPLWLLAHTGTRETFLPTLNPAPNFEALRDQP
jgi:Fe-S-cluster containining protein